MVENTTSKWDQRFYELAQHVSRWSKDPSTQVGAVIVNDLNQVLSIGYNGFPRGVRDNEERYNNRDCKHAFVVHAERNALDNAFADVRGASMYVTHFPCHECMKGIVQKGIRRIFTPRPDKSKQYVNNLLHHTAAYTMLTESGVNVTYLEDK